MTVIPLGRALPRASSHLPADSVGHVVVCLLGVAPRRDWPFHPDLTGYVSVPLILASRRTGVTRYAALWSPDFPLHEELMQRPPGLLRPGILPLRAPQESARLARRKPLAFADAPAYVRVSPNP